MTVTDDIRDQAVARIQKLLWVLDAMDEIRSDLSRYHRVDDMESMEATRFLSYAELLSCYDGAVRNYWFRRLSEQDEASPQMSQRRQEVVESFDLTPEVLASHPYFTGQFAGEVSYSQAPLAPE